MHSLKLLIVAVVFGVIQLSVPLEGLQQFNPRSRSYDKRKIACRRFPTLLSSQNDPDVLEKELSDAKDAIGRLDALKAAIKEEDADLVPLSEKVDKIENELNDLFVTPLSPEGFSLADYKLSVLTFAQLPISIKLGLYIALGLSTEVAPYPKASDYPEIVAQLHEQRALLTVDKIEDSVDQAQTRLKNRSMPKSMQEGDVDNVEEKAQAIVSELLEGKNVDTLQKENLVKQVLGRVTRKEDNSATAQDLDVLLNALNDKTVFAVRGDAEEIPGGYIVRGANRKETVKELINSIDSKVPSDWDAQVSYISDLTKKGFETPESPMDPFPVADPVLLLLKKDVSPESGFVRILSTAIALTTTLYFGLNVCANDADLSAKLAQVGESGDFTIFDQLSSQIFQVLVPVAVTQIVHQLGHSAIATKDKFKISAPVLVPFTAQLPNLGFRTDIKSSPPNLTSLFDFAFIGPFLGLTTSLVFLLYGLLATTSATPEMVQNFPALSVADIRVSTLGGSIVDFMLGGSNGAITGQELSNVLRLHPFAVGGFVSLLVQAFELIPLGSTDGGRMSLALFGRTGNVLVGGTVWFAIFLGTLFLDNASKDILLGVWVVNNFAQNDMEIPSREEVTNVDLVRGFAGLSLWFVAILAIVPF